MTADNYDDIFEQVGKQYGIDPIFLKAQAKYESGLDPNFKNPNSSASGLTAFTDATAKDYNVDRSDPHSSVDGQARLLLSNYKKFKDADDPVTSAVSAYKTGPNAGTIDPAYVKGVMQTYAQLKSEQPKVPYPIDPADAWESKVNQYSTKQNDLGYKGDIPAITVRPKDVPVQESGQQPQAASNNADPGDEWEKKILQYNVPPKAEAASTPDITTPQGSYNKKLADARQAMSTQGEGIAGVPNTAGLPAQELGYAANVETSLPFLHEATSATAAAFGKGQGDTFSERYQNNEQTQQAYRQAATEANPGANALGQVSGALATAPLLPGIGGGSTTIGGKVAAGAANGALYGTAYGLGTGDASEDPKADLETRLDNAGKGMVMGGAFGATVPAVLAAGRGLANSLVRSASPAIENGANVLHEFTGSPIDKVDTAEYVPGSKPTLANAAAYAGDPNAGNVAALEKTLSEARHGGSELYSQGFADQSAANNAARRNYAIDLVGSPEEVTSARGGRSQEANSLMGNEAKRLADPTIPKGTVWSNPNNKSADAGEALRYIDAVKNGPASGNTGLQSRLDKIQKLMTSDKASDPQYIYESVLKPHINDALDAIPVDSTAAKASERSYLLQLKDIIGDTIQNAAPDFQSYRQTYSTASKAIDRSKALQSLNLVNPEADSSYPTLNKVNNALNKITQRQNNGNSTDIFNSITDADINKLKNLQKDLTRDQSAQKLIATKGSPTSQNLNFVNKLKDTLKTEPPTWPRVIGGAMGSAIGGTAGVAAGLPPGWVAGATGLGGTVGERVGNMLSDKIAAKGSKAAVDVTDLLLNPRDYMAARNAASSGAGNNINPFNPHGAAGRFFQGTNYGPAVGYGANRLVQLANPPSPQVNH